MRITSLIMPLLASLLLMPLPALAEQDPHQMIQGSIERITARIEKEREQIKADPAYARAVVEEEIGDMVDFKRITRLVMAEHFATASTEQKYRFLEVFRDSLMNTYSSGLTLYEGQQIRVLPAEEGDVANGRARVKTEIETNAGKVVPVYFSLYLDGEGNWLVENVIVNGLNMGKTFRSQFDQSMQQYAGDFEQVIANWSSQLDVNPAEEGAVQTAKGEPKPAGGA